MNRTSSRSAFTIVELLIVIVVIAILAAIAIVAYNGVTKRAVEASMKSDLRNGSTKIEIAKNTNGAYPVDSAAAGLSQSGDNVLDYGLKPYGFCLSVTNTRAPQPIRLKSNGGQIENGSCGDAIVSNFAGTGGYDYVDGPIATAQFTDIEGITIDQSGIIYFSDAAANTVRKISTSGIVSTFAGANTFTGTADGTGGSARFSYPTDLTTDNQGNIYVADSDNCRVRKITPAGVVTTLAGSTCGYAEGTGSAAQFGWIAGVAVDGIGNVYVTDTGTSRIRKVTPAGVVTTLAGSGSEGYVDATGAAAAFYYPYGIDIDSEGNLYVTETGNDRIRKVTSTGVVTTIAGSGTIGSANGTGTAAQFNQPTDIVIDNNGTMYVTETNNDLIRMITSAGVVTTLAGSTQGHADGNGTAAQFYNPTSLTLSDNGILYIAQAGDSRIRKIDL